MTEVGGPAAINGFLYQIIQHLGWLATIRLTGQLDDEDVQNALLILEPRSGGDAYAESSDFYLVEQYKARPDRTWALSDIESVLHNLRKAVPSSPSVRATFRFVTDGRSGKLDAFHEFLIGVRDVCEPEELDDVTAKKFRSNLVVTDRGFFDHIDAVTRGSVDRSNVHERAVTLFLLRNFEMKFCVHASDQVVALESMLRPYVPNIGAEKRIREQLVGVLMERLSEGEYRLDSSGITDLLSDVGLSPERVRRYAGLPERMNKQTHDRLESLGYRANRDVRGVPAWPQNKPVMLIAGESGSGKTWQLGRLLSALGRDRHITSMVRVAVSRKDFFEQACRDVWQFGLGETEEKSLLAVSNLLREVLPDGSRPRLMLALDDVQDIGIARDLVRQDWIEWGMRLILTVPNSAADSLKLSDSETVHVHHVDDFSIEEIDSLLQLSNLRWADLAPDLKSLVRKPILAGLLMELPYSSGWIAPRSEYEILERFWDRIVAKGKAGDVGIVLALGAHVTKGNRYPLSKPVWSDIGLLDDESVVRLEGTGWIRRSVNEELGFSHDRLLNWAVAKSLVQQFATGEVTVENMAAFADRDPYEELQNIVSRLDYVPMDLLWLLAEEEGHLESVGRLVSLMEESGEFGSYGEALYVDLLPTLGERCIPILLERLQDITHGSEGDYRVTLIGNGFSALARQKNVSLDDTVDRLLKSDSGDWQKVALQALAKMRNADHLDRLWEIHQQRLRALAGESGSSRHSDYKISFTALGAAIYERPNWLRERILKADAKVESVSELGFFLNALQHPDAAELWNETKATLISKVADNKRRSVLHCIARFSDREMLDFVVSQLTRTEDFASSVALSTLSVLDPVAAIERFIEVDEGRRYLYRNEWLPILLFRHPQLTCDRFRQIAEPGIKGCRLIVDLFTERPNQLDKALVEFILRELTVELGERIDECLGKDPIWLYRVLKFLGRISNPELLGILQDEAGGELEKMITAVACSRLGNNSRHLDRIRESARRVLILMAGEGISALIREELGSRHYWVRHAGLKWAHLRPNAEIVERLSVIASRSVPLDANGHADRSSVQELHQSLLGLAAAGADKEIVSALRKSGWSEVPLKLAWLRAHCGPMKDTLTAETRRKLVSTEASDDELLLELVIAWVSGDEKLIPLVRKVLDDADPEGLVAKYASVALHKLGDTSEEFGRLAERLLHSRENLEQGVQALLGLESRGLDMLAGWLSGSKQANGSRLVDRVIRALYEYPKTRKKSIAVAVERCQRGRFLQDGPFEIAAESSDPGVREQIFDKAFVAQSSVPMQPLRAIEGLAKFDVKRAVQAVELGLRNHPRIELELCELLVRIAPKTAAQQLISAAVKIERTSLVKAVGQVLRQLDPSVVYSALLERMAGTVTERKIAVELAGWLPMERISDALGKLINDESSNEIRLGGIAALDRHHRETDVQKLVAAFPNATKERRWSLWVAIIEEGDPDLLCDPNDALWLGNVLNNDIPAAFERHANSVFRERRKTND